MSEQMTFWDSPNATSLPGLADGHSPCDLRGGRTTAQFGQGARHASHSAPQGKVQAPTTNAISGRSFTGSSTHAGPPSSSENKSRHPLSSEDRRKLRDREYGRAYRMRHRAKDLIRHAKVRAEKKGVAFDLDEHVEKIQELIDTGVCEVTGLPLNLDGGRTWDSPSLDRVNPSAGYLFSNVRVVLHALNGAMGDWGENIVIKMAKAMMKRRSDASNEFSRRIGANLKAQLSGLGSMLYELTWSEHVTPSGLVMSRLRASAPRTSGSGSTGVVSARPTPAARDWKGSTLERWGTNARPLNEVAVLCGWPTPTSALAGKGVRTFEGGLIEAMRNHGPDLAAMACMTLTDAARSADSGPALTGSPVGTTSGGQLSPAHSRWLMGYPPEWDDCGVTAMRSCQRLPRRS